MTRVLIATDGSDFAIRAAQQAATVLADDVEYTVVMVVRPPTYVAGPVGGMPASAMADPALIEAADDEAHAAVTATAEHVDIRSSERVEHGDPGTVICEIAEHEAFDLIVLGSHGSGLIKRVLLGSVSHHVLHHAPCPVLLVPKTDMA